ncbi:hypothetical protein WR25_06735 [Diploscapter pachys]|uniref:Uncharacterized protein n=1 Tax=Diploscapter pachys TaxID=2018661 RepID=A0A2A2KWX1_9BILA|nr:hypothetical protein WR25_06735 [Diploscapter pachys]
MNYTRYGHSLIIANGKLYAIGGKFQDISMISFCNSIEEYDPQMNKWREIGKINLQIGGDISFKNWHKILFYGPDPPEWREDASVAYFKEKVYYLGGKDPETEKATDRVDISDAPYPLVICPRSGEGIPKLVPRHAGSPCPSTPHTHANPASQSHAPTSTTEASLDIFDNNTGSTWDSSAGSIVYNDQKIPGTPGLLRPDIAIIDNAAKSCVIVDVVVTYENRKDALVAARMDKIRKYEVLKLHFERLGYRTTLDAYVVGTLGSMDPLNRRAVAALNINATYNRLMQKLVVSDVIKWARDVYTEHVSGVRQYA